MNQDALLGAIDPGIALNRYAFANGNPVSLTDPFGLYAEAPGLLLKLVVPAGIGAAAAGPPGLAVGLATGLLLLAMPDTANAPEVPNTAYAPTGADAQERERFLADPNLNQNGKERCGSQADSTAAESETMLLPQFTSSTIDDVVASAARARSSQITEGARAIAKKLGHAESGGYTSAFQGIDPTQANAESLIRDIMSNPSRTFYGNRVIDIYNAAGQGVRIETRSGRFIGFLEGGLATQ